MSKYIEPEINLNAFNCPHCGALADQVWFDAWADPIKEKGIPLIPRDDISEYCDTERSKSPNEADRIEWEKLKKRLVRKLKGNIVLQRHDQGNYSYYEIENLFLSSCFSCKKPSLWHFQELIYPNNINEFVPNEDLSDDIKNDFFEASKIYDMSPRGAAAILRLCIQKLCIETGEKGKNINDDIASLVKKGLDIKIQKALDIVRVIGNNAVHPGQIDLNDNKAVAKKLFGLINLIADAMITQPKMIDELFNELPKNTKDAISKRDSR